MLFVNIRKDDNAGDDDGDDNGDDGGDDDDETGWQPLDPLTD